MQFPNKQTNKNVLSCYENSDSISIISTDPEFNSTSILKHCISTGKIHWPLNNVVETAQVHLYMGFFFYEYNTVLETYCLFFMIFLMIFIF